MKRLALLFLLGFVLGAAPARAQAIATLDDSSAFNPADFGIVTFGDPKELFNRLTEEGRCPVDKMAAERQPCAFIFYELKSGTGKRINFKPVFKVVSEKTLWVMHNSELKKVTVDNLYNDVVTLKGQVGRYTSIGVVGNFENRQNCDNERPCLSRLVSQDMFLMYWKMPQTVVDVLWHRGPSDPNARLP